MITVITPYMSKETYNKIKESILNKDVKYVKNLMQGICDCKLSKSQIDFLDNQIPILVAKEIDKTEKYLTILKELNGCKVNSYQ